LIRALLAAGYEVVAVAPPDDHVPRIEALGVRFVPLAMDNKGTIRVGTFGLFLRFVSCCGGAAAVFLGYTIKPNV